MSEARFAIGDTVRDEISGIQGVIDKITLSAYAEPEYRLVRDGVNCDGKLWEPEWLYEGRLREC